MLRTIGLLYNLAVSFGISLIVFRGGNRNNFNSGSINSGDTGIIAGVTYNRAVTAITITVIIITASSAIMVTIIIIIRTGTIGFRAVNINIIIVINCVIAGFIIVIV